MVNQVSSSAATFLVEPGGLTSDKLELVAGLDVDEAQCSCVLRSGLLAGVDAIVGVEVRMQRPVWGSLLTSSQAGLNGES